MNKLDEICAAKRVHVTNQKTKVSLADLKSKIADAPSPRGFIRALRAKGSPALIAEVKKASPSKGLIRKDFDPAAIAKAYERAGASCISVLTDTPYFQGCDDDLRTVRGAATLPLLRKDFMVDAYQIYESRALGADCVLLIMAALDDSLAAEMHLLAGELGMDVLVEVHDKTELGRALALNPAMVGVNSRNLKTLAVDIQTAHDLASAIPKSTLAVAESGIATHDDIKALQSSGYSAFLVGESLMRQENIEEAVKKLLTQTVN